MAHQTTNPDIESDVHRDVTSFLQQLDKALKSKDLALANSLYEVKLPQLSEAHYSTRNLRGALVFKPWPHMRFVKNCFTSPATELLYQNHYFRGVFSQLSVSPNQRQKSWDHYEALFKTLLAKNLDIDVPNGMLWDCIDECIYQLQIHRLKPLKATDALPTGTWEVQSVLALFERVVDESQVLTLLNSPKAKNDAPLLLEAGPDHVKLTLGYFALIGILRVRVLLGDYQAAMVIAGALFTHSFGRSISVKVPAVHVSLYYHIGFSYMMLRRYSDAYETLRSALSVKAITRKFVEALQGQVLCLIAISSTLGDIPANDLQKAMQERSRVLQEDDLMLLAQGDLERYRDLFSRASPKFISPIAEPVQADAGPSTQPGQEAKDLQIRLFMREVQQQQDVLKLRGYLRVYSVLSTEKLSALLADSADAATSDALSYLIRLKNKSQQMHFTGSGSPLDGEVHVPSYLDFTVNGNEVRVMRHRDEVPVSVQLFDKVMMLKKREAAQASEQNA